MDIFNSPTEILIMKSNDEVKADLQAPFEPEDIEWRIQKKGLTNKRPWAMVVPYITNRAIQKRLDDVFGVFGWENSYRPAPPSTITVKEWSEKENKKVEVEKIINNWLCGITIIDGDKRVTKWDGAEETNIEPFKGGLSGSMKRTGSQMGIGRYLYQLEVRFAVCVVVDSRRDCNDDYPNYDSIKIGGGYINFAWGNPDLPEWALPGSDFEQFLEPVKNAATILDLRKRFTTAYRQAQSSGNNDNIKILIKAKDKRKAELEQKLIDEAKQNHQSVVDWMNKQIDMFAEIPNESSVTQVYETTIRPALISNAKAFNLEVEPLLKTLKEAYDLRIKQLQPPKKDVKNDN